MRLLPFLPDSPTLLPGSPTRTLCHAPLCFSPPSSPLLAASPWRPTGGAASRETLHQFSFPPSKLASFFLSIFLLSLCGIQKTGNYLRFSSPAYEPELPKLSFTYSLFAQQRVRPQHQLTMDKQSSLRVRKTRQPLGDASWRVNHGAADRASGPRQSVHRQTSPPAKIKKEDPVRSNLPPVAKSPAQSEKYPSSLVESVHTDNRLSAMTYDSGDPAPSPAPSEVKRESQFSNISSTASSIRARKTHIGPWQLGKTLGKGSSARVRAARHRVTHQLAAVKIVAKSTSQLTQAGSLAQLAKVENSQPVMADGVRRIPLAIEREVAIMKLIEHPNIVRMFDIWENRSEM